MYCTRVDGSKTPSFLKHNVGPLAGVGIWKVVNKLMIKRLCSEKRERDVQTVQKRNACCVGKAVLFLSFCGLHVCSRGSFSVVLAGSLVGGLGLEERGMLICYSAAVCISWMD